MIVTELSKGSKFTLFQVKNRFTGRVHYKIKTDNWAWRNSGDNPSLTIEEVRKHFNPGGSGASRFAYSWKFSNRADAEKLLMLAILKWGS